jgi:hypothetical protein
VASETPVGILIFESPEEVETEAEDTEIERRRTEASANLTIFIFRGLLFGKVGSRPMEKPN